MVKYSKEDISLDGKRIMALDLGEKNIGVAISDVMGWTAQPLTTLRRSGMDSDMQFIKDLCSEHQVGSVVLGYPLNMNGTAGEAAKRAEKFRTKLMQELAIEVHLWDERLSTSRADQVMLEADVSRQRRKKNKDKLAASIILESFLQSRPSGYIER